MFVPYSTDAPLYHLPLATGGIIVANIAIYFATTFQVTIGNIDPEQISWLMIQFNQINPLQWITGSFMHAGLGHLLGNMIFLFCFGLVVEGKAGNLGFLAIYFGCCMLIGAVAQIPMFLMGDEGAALGASGVISSLMVIALVWAPENEISFFYFIAFFLFGTFEVRILTVCFFYLGLDLLELVLSGFSMSGAMGHVIGALIGFPIAIYCLRSGKVDCEGWDVVSRNEWLQEYPILYGDKQRERDQDTRNEVNDPVATALALAGGDVTRSQTIGLTVAAPEKKRPAEKKKRATSPPKGLRHRKGKRSVSVASEKVAEQCQTHPEFNRLTFVLRQSLQSSNLPAAQQAFLKIDGLKIGAGLSEQSLMQYASELGRQKQWVNAIRPLAIVIEKRGAMADDACLRLAQIQLKVLKRPDHAIATLEKISLTQESATDEAKRRRLAKRDELLALARRV